jgi:hypothetical protein
LKERKRESGPELTPINQGLGANCARSQQDVRQRPLVKDKDIKRAGLDLPAP